MQNQGQVVAWKANVAVDEARNLKTIERAEAVLARFDVAGSNALHGTMTSEPRGRDDRDREPVVGR